MGTLCRLMAADTVYRVRMYNDDAVSLPISPLPRSLLLMGLLRLALVGMSRSRRLEETASANVAMLTDWYWRRLIHVYM